MKSERNLWKKDLRGIGLTLLVFKLKWRIEKKPSFKRSNKKMTGKMSTPLQVKLPGPWALIQNQGVLKKVASIDRWKILLHLKESKKNKKYRTIVSTLEFKKLTAFTFRICKRPVNKNDFLRTLISHRNTTKN